MANRNPNRRPGPARKPLRNLFARWIDTAEVTVADFAAEVGVTTATVYNWRSGKMRPSLELAVAIEHVTGGKVPAAYWAGRKPERA